MPRIGHEFLDIAIDTPSFRRFPSADFCGRNSLRSKPVEQDIIRAEMQSEKYDGPVRGMTYAIPAGRIHSFCDLVIAGPDPVSPEIVEIRQFEPDTSEEHLQQSQ